MRDLADYRSEFPVLERTAYLISASLGPIGTRARGAHRRLPGRVGRQGRPRPRVVRGHHPGDGRPEAHGSPASRAAIPTSSRSPRTSRSRCRRSPPASTCPAPRNRIVLSELDFPTDGHVWLAQPGAEIVWLRSEDGLTIPLEAYRDAIDERTAVVMVNRVLYRSSAIVDAKAVCAMAHEAGALSFVDDYHGAGILPLDLHDLGCDLYCGRRPEVAVRRAGPGLPVRAARPAADARAPRDRLVRDRGAVLVRHGAPRVPPHARAGWSTARRRRPWSSSRRAVSM